MKDILEGYVVNNSTYKIQNTPFVKHQTTASGFN